MDEVDLDSLPLWAQIHGFPLGHSTQDMAIVAASQIGEVLEVDFRSSKAVWVTQFIRVKVLVALSHPLSPGFFLPSTNRDDTWIQFKYEKVSGFCFNCGLLGHLTNSCQAAPSGRVEPATFSSRMFAHSQEYRRFVAPNRLIPKGPVLLRFHHNAPAQSQHNQQSGLGSQNLTSTKRGLHLGSFFIANHRLGRSDIVGERESESTSSRANSICPGAAEVCFDTISAVVGDAMLSAVADLRVAENHPMAHGDKKTSLRWR